METKPKLAYVVRCQELSEIVFATSSVAARRIGAVEMDAEFSEVDSCTRDKRLDEFVDKDYYADKVMIEEYGFVYECLNCYNPVDSNQENRCFDDKGRAHCSQHCLTLSTGK